VTNLPRIAHRWALPGRMLTQGAATAPPNGHARLTGVLKSDLRGIIKATSVLS
jgi:hypothetical protein